MMDLIPSKASDMAGALERLTAALADRYRIERELGQGGMATVYLAEDLKHDRRVALKILKPELAAVLGAERFVVEIKTTAALQHPHILPLFDSGTADGFLYYVMPYVEGETLRSKLDRETQLGIEEAVRITTEVADALDYAHRHGVIHRDIKPENILLHDGRPMVADFGIALAVSAAAGGRMTETGLSLGTPHYMSPEQATAEKEITARSDVYSLGSVLYEMLTGNPPHVGATAQQIIMKIVTEEAAPVTKLRKSVPPNVAAAVAQAIERLPADRFDSARAFAEALRNPSFRSATGTVPGVSGPGAVRVMGREVSWRAVAALLTILSGALAIAWLSSAPRAAGGAGQVVRSETNFLSPSDSGIRVAGLDISPDGGAIVFAATQSPDTTFRLYLRQLDDREARVIPGTEGARSPAFSPDGQSIAFAYQGREIRRTQITGVAVESIVPPQGSSRFISGLRWAADGYLYYDDDNAAGLTRVPAGGGQPTPFVGGDPEDPDPLPDGRHVLYTECCSDTSDVRVVDITTGETRSVGARAQRVRYLAPGYLLLFTRAALKAVVFDPRQLTVRGEPFTLLDSVAANGSVREFAVSPSGVAAYIVQPFRSTTFGVALVDLVGRPQRLPLPAQYYGQIRFSPDGRRIAYSHWSSSSPADTLSVHDLVVGNTTHWRTRGWATPLWAPDGNHLLYGVVSMVDSLNVLIRLALDGSGNADTLWKARFRPREYGVRLPLSLSPDGRHLLLEEYSPNSNLRVAALDSTLGPATDYLAADWEERNGQISPDGRWVVYESSEERGAGFRQRVYARSFPEPGTRFTVSDSTASEPRWAPDGRTIYYWRDQTLVAAAVRTTPSFAVTERRDLFTLPGALTWTYDASPNGQGFVLALAPDSGAAGQSALTSRPPRLVLVANWLEEFRRKAGLQR